MARNGDRYDNWKKQKLDTLVGQLGPGPVTRDVVIVDTDADRSGVYIDGLLRHQGHSLSADDYIWSVAGEFPNTRARRVPLHEVRTVVVPADTMDDLGHLPARLDELLKVPAVWRANR